jgi:Tol biopolymer transport system component
VQEQPLQILEVLLEQAGLIVPREDLQRRLWPDGTFVDYEQSLNKAVNKLREALGDSADHPIYIETLTRRGYRFVTPVDQDQPVQCDLPVPPPVPVAVPRRRVPIYLTAVGLVLAIMLGTGLWPIGVPQVQRVVPLTNDLTNKLVPLFSDGSRVFYSDLRDIWSVPTSGGSPRKQLALEFLADERNTILAGYSPTRQQMLLKSWGPGPAIWMWLVGQEGETPRKIGETESDSVALAPDAVRLAISLPDGIYIQSIANGERKRIHAMKSMSPSALWWHPSGHALGFRDTSRERSNARVWQVNDDGSHPRQVGPEEAQGQGAGVWSMDGNRFFYRGLDGEIFVRTQAGMLGWLRKPAVNRLTASGQFGTSPAVDPLNPRRLYALGTTSRGETVRYDRRARKWVTFLARFSGESIDFSPDGKWMVYVKFPGAELHKCKRDGSGDVVLAPGVYALNPSWSPDGKRIAFPGRPSDTDGELKVWLVSADGGDAAPYRPGIASGYDTVWSRDGKRILLGQIPFTRIPGENNIKIIHLETGRLETVPGSGSLFSPRWSPDEKQIVALRTYNKYPQIWDSEKGQWRELIERSIGFPKWSKDGRYLYARTVRGEDVLRVEVATGRSEEIAHMEFATIGNVGAWVGWTDDWEPLTIRDSGSTQVYRIDLDR